MPTQLCRGRGGAQRPGKVRGSLPPAASFSQHSAASQSLHLQASASSCFTAPLPVPKISPFLAPSSAKSPLPSCSCLLSAVGSWSSGANSSQPSGNHSGVVPGGGQEAGGFWPAPSALRTGRRGRKSHKCRAFKFSGRLQPEQGDRAPRVVPMGVQGGLGGGMVPFIGAPRVRLNREGAGVPAPSESPCMKHGEMEQGAVFL